MNDTLQTLYPLPSKHAQIALVLPMSNADSERGSTCMNRVKTDLCNRLTVSSWDTLLQISIEGPSLTSPEPSQSRPLGGTTESLTNNFQIMTVHLF